MNKSRKEYLYPNLGHQQIIKKSNDTNYQNGFGRFQHVVVTLTKKRKRSSIH